MKKVFYTFTLLLIANFIFVGCLSEPTTESEIVVANEETLTQTVFANDEKGESSVNIRTLAPWTSSIREIRSATDAETKTERSTSIWVSITPENGGIGNYEISLTLEPNTTGADRTVEITITSGGATITIRITQKAVREDDSIPVAGVSLNESELELVVGETETLIATVSPANATNRAVTWTSSDTEIATVNNNGVVTALSAGTATITATTTDGEFTAYSIITVTNPPRFTLYFEYHNTGNPNPVATFLTNILTIDLFVYNEAGSLVYHRPSISHAQMQHPRGGTRSGRPGIDLPIGNGDNELTPGNRYRVVAWGNAVRNSFDNQNQVNNARIRTATDFGTPLHFAPGRLRGSSAEGFWITINDTQADEYAVMQFSRAHVEIGVYVVGVWGPPTVDLNNVAAGIDFNKVVNTNTIQFRRLVLEWRLTPEPIRRDAQFVNFFVPLFEENTDKTIVIRNSNGNILQNGNIRLRDVISGNLPGNVNRNVIPRIRLADTNVPVERVQIVFEIEQDTTRIIETRVTSSQWASTKNYMEAYHYFVKELPELTEDIFNRGMIQVYFVRHPSTRSQEVPLPFSLDDDSYVTFTIRLGQNGQPSTITFIVMPPDRNLYLYPPDMDFRIVLSW